MGAGESLGFLFVNFCNLTVNEFQLLVLRSFFLFSFFFFVIRKALFYNYVNGLMIYNIKLNI
jgi:hypothetical protein